MSFSTSHIDYLTRSYLENLTQVPTDLEGDIPDPLSISFVKVSSIPRIWEEHEKMVVAMQELMQDVIVGIRGMMLPLIYFLLGEDNLISIYFGTFSQNPSDIGIDSKIISSILTSAYPGIEFELDQDSEIKTFRLYDLKSKLSIFDHTIIVTGLPTTKISKDKIGIGQIDRLIRGFYGKKWAYIVIAKPIKASEVTAVYNKGLVETKMILDTEAQVQTKNPIARRYKLLIKSYLKKLAISKAQGAWETCSYLLCSDATTLRRGQGIMESVFGGSKSELDPIRTIVAEKAGQFAKSFGQIITSAPRGFGNIQHRYKYMTRLSSPDLASFVHLPTHEMPGFFVKRYARFDVYPHKEYEKDTIDLGEVVDEGRPMGCQYKIGLKDLNKHTLIVGATGSGKTNTIFHLLKQLWKIKIPFLVIEPAKTEYRKLLNSKELGSELRVFTLGDETSPFRLNPFEILHGVSLQTHIDHLKSVFGATFPMWAPMPQVLERAIHEIYQDKGWRLVEDTNPRGISRNAFPTLTDLYMKIEEVTQRLGYEERVTMDVQAALKTRINSLRIGGKGLMLDVGKGIPLDKLMDSPTVLELEAVADDDEKALLIGLLLIFLQEHYQARRLREGTELQHITIIEEAHRLLANVGRAMDSEVANTRWKAVETFTNILSELRAYGEGFIIAEQIPSKLAPDVVKNTNLKIMHRIVSEEDRHIIGSSMNLDDRGSKRVTSITAGEAVIFREGDDSPFRIKVPYSKIRVENNGIDRDMVKNKMSGFWSSLPEVYTPFDNCDNYCDSICKYRNAVGKIIEDDHFQEMIARFVLTAVEEPKLVIEEYEELEEKIRSLWGGADYPRGIALCAFIQAIHRYFESRGGQYQWNYDDTSRLKSHFMKIVHRFLINYGILSERRLTAKEREDFIKELTKDLRSLRTMYLELTMNIQPYRNLCSRICTDGTCLFRFGVKELIRKPDVINRFKEIFSNYEDEVLTEKMIEETKHASSRVISGEMSSQSRYRATLCCALHITLKKWPHESYKQVRFMEKLFEEYSR